MMEPDNPRRIDEHVAAALGDIAMGWLELLAVQKGLEIGPPGLRAPDIPERGRQHAIGPIEFALFIHKDRPDQTGVGDVLPGEKPGLEGDHDDAHVAPGEFRFLFPQLREVRSAGKSPKVAVEDQEQPVAAEFL